MRVAKVKAIVVTGQGAMFCGGAEITERLGEKLETVETYGWLVVSNHGILNDFPETVGNFIIPTDEVRFFRGIQSSKQRHMGNVKWFNGVLVF